MYNFDRDYTYNLAKPIANPRATQLYYLIPTYSTKTSKIKIKDEHLVECLADIECQLMEMLEKTDPNKTLVDLVDLYRDHTVQISDDTREILEMMQDLEIAAAMRGSERQM